MSRLHCCTYITFILTAYHLTNFNTILLPLHISHAYIAQTISATVKDTNIDGLEGINLKWTAPFKFQDYIVGFKYNLCSLKKAPEEFFAKRSIATGLDGKASIDATYNLASKTTSIAARWVSDKLGFTVSADGDTNDSLTQVGIETTQDFQGNKVNLEGKYDLLNSKISGSANINVDDTSVKVAYDTLDRNPVLSVSHKLDSNNVVEPSVSLKNGAMKYGWTRNWNGGSIESQLTPGDKLSLTWKDNGASGTWTTKADIPIEDQSKTKISFSRDWNY